MGGILNGLARCGIANRTALSALDDCVGDRAMKLASRALFGLGCMAFATVVGAQTTTTINPAAATKAVELCSTCHGPYGISTSPNFPILAAQREGYLEAQIEAFRSHSRAEKDAHDIMWGIAGNLDPAIIKGIAQYYAAQPPPMGRVEDPAAILIGQEMFDKGVPSRGIPPCAACHGPDAKGQADFPRLAGQHATYIVKQLNYIQSLVRAAPVMHGIVKDLTPAEIQAVAVYVQSK
jgi:cytochrome c553